MAGSLNSVMVIGTVEADPEMRFSQEGVPVTNFTVGVNRHWRDREGNPQESTDWLHVVAWDKLAESCNAHAPKGTSVYVEGHLKTRNWETQDGQKHYRTEVIANSVNLVARAPADGSSDEGQVTESSGDADALPVAALNRVTVIGNVGRDPEMRSLPSGTQVASFSVAANRRWRDKEGNSQEETEWVRVSAWDRLAEICHQYAVKGRQVYIEGRLQTRSYEGRDGQKRQWTEVRANTMMLLGSRPGGAAVPGDVAESTSTAEESGEDEIPF